jgi:hypothetical protein
MARKKKSYQKKLADSKDLPKIIKPKGELNPKYPGGMEEQAKRLRKEGHKIEKRGKRWFVKGVV